MSEQVGSWEIQAAAHLEEIDRLRKDNEALRVRLGGALYIIDNLKPDADRLLWALQYPTKFCSAAMPKNYPHVSDDDQRKSIDAARRGDG